MGSESLNTRPSQQRGNTRHLSACSPYIDSIFVLCGSFVLNFTIFGALQSFGIIYRELLENFQSGKGETSWVASLSPGIMLVLGPAAGVLQQKIGCRLLAISGALCITIGMLSSSFVPSLYLLYLTYGILCGVGFCFTNQVASVLVPVYFDKRPSLATAFTSSGGSIGTIVMPFLISWWLDEYTWRGTFILMACISIQGVVFGSLMNDRKYLHNENFNKDEYSQNKLRTTENSITSTFHTMTILQIIKNLFLNKRFCLFAVSGFFVTFAYFGPYVMLPDFVKQKGITDDDAALIITTSGISGLVGRMIMGFVCDIRVVNRCLLNGTILILGGLATIGCSFIYQYWLFIIYAAFLGIFTGTFAFLLSVITKDICGGEQLGMAFGILSFFHGVAVIIGPPVAGWLVDITGRYDGAFYFQGILFAVGGLFSIFIPTYERCTKQPPKRGPFNERKDVVNNVFDIELARL